MAGIKPTDKEKKALPIIDNGGVTPEQVTAWEARYGKVHKFSRYTQMPNPKEGGGEVAVIYCRECDMEEHSMYLKHLQNNDPKRANCSLIENCMLGGSEQIKTDEKLLRSFAFLDAGKLATLYTEYLGEF